MKSQLSRIESLGDNCELGFVLRRLGHEDGSLFRWSAMPPDSLLATLKADFDRFYEFDDLEPFDSTMVRDRRYGTAWHSGIASIKQANKWAFRDDRPTRLAIYANEVSKRTYLLRKFRHKLESSSPLFVIKSKAAIPDATLEALHYQLYRRVSSLDFTLLEVRADQAKAGSVETVDRNLLRGYVRRFASYEDAEDGDDASWHSVLAAALASGARSAASAEDRCLDVEPIVLRFPAKERADLTRYLPADLRAGAGELHNGTEWCRTIEDDIYRLHGRLMGQDATRLSWTGVRAPAGWDLKLHAICTVPGTIALAMSVILADRQRRIVKHVGRCSEDEQFRLTVTVPPGFEPPLTVLIGCEPIRPLVGDERAVTDVAPILIGPPARQETRPVVSSP